MINLQTLVNEAVLANNSYKGGLRDKSHFHVSDAGTCYRKRYFKRLGVQPTGDIPVASLRKMLAGDAGHSTLQHVLKKAGSLFAAEGEIETEHIMGHFDAIVKAADTKALVEIKTTEKFQMGYIKKEGPKPEHVLQMFTYWGFLRDDYTTLDQATLFYVKREDFEGVQFDFVWSEAIKAEVAQEWLPLIKYWEAEQVPPCTCPNDYGGSGIKYCRYANEEQTECCSLELLNNMKELVA